MNQSSKDDDLFGWDQFEQFKKERHEFLMKGDYNDGMERFCKKWKIRFHKSANVREIILHKARTGCMTLPKEMRDASVRWLTEKGYSHFADS